MMLKVKFKGKYFYLTSGNFHNSPLATKKQYENFRESYAHLIDGKVMRHRQVIGSSKDVKVIKKISDLKPTPEASRKYEFYDVELLELMSKPLGVGKRIKTERSVEEKKLSTVKK